MFSCKIFENFGVKVKKSREPGNISKIPKERSNARSNKKDLVQE